MQRYFAIKRMLVWHLFSFFSLLSMAESTALCEAVVQYGYGENAAVSMTALVQTKL